MFYISSRGHSATTWVSKQISKHNKVVCWHGTRSIPPAVVGINDISPEDFVKGLKILEKQEDERIYGAVHGFHGVKIKNEIEKEGGRFAGIFRDPVSKISSFFYAYLWSRLSKGNLPENYVGPTDKLFNKKLDDKIVEEFEILKRISNDKKQNVFQRFYNFANMKIKNNKNNFYNKKNLDQKKLENIILSQDNSKVLSDLFFQICKQTFMYDSEIFQNCKQEQLIIMENMVSNKNYFVDNVWNYLIPELKDKAVTDGFEKKANKHNPNIHLNSQQKFEQFPNSFQKLLTWFFSKQDKDLIKFYKKNNYFIT